MEHTPRLFSRTSDKNHLRIPGRLCLQAPLCQQVLRHFTFLRFPLQRVHQLYQQCPHTRLQLMARHQSPQFRNVSTLLYLDRLSMGLIGEASNFILEGKVLLRIPFLPLLKVSVWLSAKRTFHLFAAGIVPLCHYFLGTLHMSTLVR